MAEHLPEPWEATSAGGTLENMWKVSSGEYRVCLVPAHSDGVAEATAKRIALVGTFCKDIPDDVLSAEARTDEYLLALFVLQKKEAAAHALADHIVAKSSGEKSFRYVYIVERWQDFEGHSEELTTTDKDEAIDYARRKAAGSESSDVRYRVFCLDVATCEYKEIETVFAPYYQH